MTLERLDNNELHYVSSQGLSLEMEHFFSHEAIKFVLYTHESFFTQALIFTGSNKKPE